MEKENIEQYMRSQFLFILFLFISMCSIAQVGSNDCRKSTPVFDFAEKMPEPAGGMDSLKKIFQKEFASWGLNNQTRLLKLDLLINNDGTACPYMIHVDPYSLPTEKIMNAIKTMPNWNPAEQNGYKIDCYVKLSLQIESGILTKLTYNNRKE